MPPILPGVTNCLSSGRRRQLDAANHVGRLRSPTRPHLPPSVWCQNAASVRATRLPTWCQASGSSTEPRAIQEQRLPPDSGCRAEAAGLRSRCCGELRKMQPRLAPRLSCGRKQPLFARRARHGSGSRPRCSTLSKRRPFALRSNESGNDNGSGQAVPEPSCFVVCCKLAVSPREERVTARWQHEQDRVCQRQHGQTIDHCYAGCPRLIRPPAQFYSMPAPLNPQVLHLGTTRAQGKHTTRLSWDGQESLMSLG